MNKKKINDDSATNSAPIPTSIPPPIITTGNPIKLFIRSSIGNQRAAVHGSRSVYITPKRTTLNMCKHVNTFPRTEAEDSNHHSLEFQREQQSSYENTCLVIRTIRNEVTAKQNHRDTEKYITISEWSLEEDEDTN